MASPVVVVQGTPVNQQQAFGSALSSPPPQQNQQQHTTDHSEKQESSCNDPIFAILFYMAVAAIVAVAVIYGPAALSSSSNNSNVQYSGYVKATSIFVVVSFLGAGAGMALLFVIPQFLIKSALIFTVVMAGVAAVFGFVSGSIGAGVLGIIFFALTLCYARAVWSRIPFATVNLVTACTAIRANLGVAIYAYIFAIIAGAWAICWSVALAGVFDQTYTCQGNGNTQVCSNPSYGLLFLLFLAFFFVQQVIQVRFLL